MEMPASWDPSFSVGHDLMDNQHKHLLSICSRVARMVDDESHAATLQFHEALHDRADYTRNHFAAEEALLRDCSYTHLDAHVAEHSDCLTRLTDFLYAASHGVIAKNELHDFLVNWWANHVSSSDLQYAAYLRSAG